jgi:hypothetical protein
MFVLFATALGLAALAEVGRPPDALKGQIIQMLRVLVLVKDHREMVLTSDVRAIMNRLAGLGLKDPWRYEGTVREALEDPDFVRYMRWTNLLGVENEVAFRLLSAAPWLRDDLLGAVRLFEVIEPVRRAPYGHGRGLILTEREVAAIAVGSLPPESGEGIQLVNGNENYRAWIRLVSSGRGLDLPGEAGSFLPMSARDWLDSGDLALRAIIFPTENVRPAGPPTLAWLVADPTEGGVSWKGSTGTARIYGRPDREGFSGMVWAKTHRLPGSDVGYSELASEVVEALASWDRWPRLHGAPVGRLSNGWEVVSVGSRDKLEELERWLPTGRTVFDMGQNPVRNPVRSRRRWRQGVNLGLMSFGLRDPETLSMIGVFDVDAQGVPNEMEARGLSDRRVSWNRTTNIGFRMLFPRIFRTVVEGAPEESSYDSVGKIERWMAIMEEATVIAGQEVARNGLMDERPLVAEIPDAREVQAAAKRVGGSVATASSLHSAQAFVAAIHRGLAWADEHDVDPGLVRVRLSGAKGISAHTTVEWNASSGIYYGLRAKRHDRVNSGNNSAELSAIRERGPQLDGDIVEISVRVPTWNPWYSEVFLQNPDRLPKSKRTSTPYYDTLDYGSVVVEEERV